MDSSLTSRFNATLKLKEELEARVKFLASEVEQLDPYVSTDLWIDVSFAHWVADVYYPAVKMFLAGQMDSFKAKA
jgi:hypothetical protein